ncbi:unnamed protein product, partial [Vitis vinifera]
MASREVLNFVQGCKLNETLLKKLKIALQTINAVLKDAEVKQITNPEVKEWADELKDAVYHAEDLLDQIATKASRYKMNADIRISAIQKGIGEKLPKRWPSTSLVDESGVYGRGADKEEIIKFLLSHCRNGDKICVISIVGAGCVGKTTLAQLVYNDKRVKQHFDLQAWVCVSDEFDPFRVVKQILEATNSGSCESYCWSLFARHAFDNGDSSPYPKLEEIGKEIVKKCNGLPLAAKTLGGPLYSNVKADKWDNVLKSEMWGFPGNKKRQELDDMEELGDHYFEELLSRSLFEKSRSSKSCFVMHDFINDLAQLISGEFCIRLESGEADEILEKARHLSYFRSECDALERQFATFTLLEPLLHTDAKSCGKAKKFTNIDYYCGQEEWVKNWRVEGAFTYSGETLHFKTTECDLW